jgi:hypothetical protein
VGPEAAIKDRARVLVGGIEVDQSLGGKVAVEHQEDGSVVEKQGEPFPVVLYHSLVGLVRIVVYGRVVAIAVVGGKVVLIRDSLAGAGYAVKENAPEVGHNVAVYPCGFEGLQNCRVVSVSPHMGASNPAD